MISSDLLTYLSSQGDVFRVFDRQDSGCISYGLATSEGRYFIKSAQHPEGIAALRRAIALHTQLQHPLLPPLRHHFEFVQGLALVYDWVDGEVLYGPDFMGEAGRNHPDSPHYRFRQLPTATIIHALTQIYALHVQLATLGYVAMDFYDGCILYDFQRQQVYLCDLDEYRLGPFRLEQDRLPGSTRFMAPEESCRGAWIDQATTVYALGQAAWVLLNHGQRSRTTWPAEESRFEAVMTATQAERSQRFQTVAEFLSAWQS